MVALPPAEILVELNARVPGENPVPDPLPNESTVVTLLDEEDPPPPPALLDEDPGNRGALPLLQANKPNAKKLQINFFID